MSSSFIAGMTLADGQYRLARPMRPGAFGAPWVATHVESGDQVVLKFPKKPVDVKQVEREIDQLRRVAGEGSAQDSWRGHVVRYRGRFTHDGDPVLVMDYVEGQDLHDLLGPGNSLTNDQKRAIFIGICKGLRLFKAANCAHMDIKPLNIVVASGTSSHAVIVDLGCAHGLDSAMTTRAGWGTPPFNPPDHGRGRHRDRDDVYRAGLVGWCLYHGARQPPDIEERTRRGVDVGEACDDPVIRSVIREMTEPLESRRPDINAVIAAIERGVPLRPAIPPPSPPVPKPTPPYHSGESAAPTGDRRLRFIAVALAISAGVAVFAGAVGWYQMNANPPAYVAGDIPEQK